MRILIIEEDLQLSESFRLQLEQSGYAVDIARDGSAGEEYASLKIYDLLVVDAEVSPSGGSQLIKRLRIAKNPVPVLMLNPPADVESRIEGLEAGADCCMAKPIHIRELLACINAILRRQGNELDTLSFGNTSLDLTACVLHSINGSVPLSAREFDVMRLLLHSKNNILSKETLLTKVWGYDTNATENSVEVYIGFLRKKLSGIGSDIRILSIRRLGYRLETNTPERQS